MLMPSTLCRTEVLEHLSASEILWLTERNGLSARPSGEARASLAAMYTRTAQKPSKESVPLGAAAAAAVAWDVAVVPGRPATTRYPLTHVL